MWLAKEHKLIALNGSGRAPSGATPQHLAERGFHDQMPLHGIDSATVPGAVDGWDALLRRAGTMTFKQVLQPAVELAEQGFAVSERIHNDWIYGAQVIAGDPEVAGQLGENPDPFAIAQRPGGRYRRWAGVSRSN